MDSNALAGGAIYGFGLALLAVAIPFLGRRLLAATLVAAALSYVFFSLDARAGAAWLAVELTGVGIFGYAAMRGLRGSAWWLVAGWALHAVWNVGLHNVGMG